MHFSYGRNYTVQSNRYAIFQCQNNIRGSWFLFALNKKKKKEKKKREKKKRKNISSLSKEFFFFTLFTLNVKMKLTTQFIYLLYTLGKVINARPTHQNTTIEADASLQIAKWEKQYHQYIKATIKTRKSGCTSNNIVYRQEWYNLIFSRSGILGGGGKQTEAPKFY